MQQGQSTPSVDFHFEDTSESHPSGQPAFDETEVKYELSCTNDKKINHFEATTGSPYRDVHREYRLLHHSSIESVNTDEFYKDFESKFVVTFDEAERSFVEVHSRQATNSLQNQENRCGLRGSHNQLFEPIRLSIPTIASKDFFGSSLIKRQELKSDIISLKKKGNCHPILAIKKKNQMQRRDRKGQQALTDKITKKKSNGNDLSKVNFPQTFRNFNGLFFFDWTVQRDSGLMKKISRKAKRSSASQKASSMLEKSMLSTGEGLSVSGKNKPFSKFKGEKKELERSNIFLKLPYLR